jgi:hypothetical protein
MMKNAYIFIALSLMFALFSCDKAFENGELDGMWKLQKVELQGENGSVCTPEGIYYSFQRHLVLLGEYYPEAAPQLYMAKFEHKGGVITMNDFYEHPGIEGICSMEALEKYFIFDGIMKFKVRGLNDKALHLESDYGNYYFVRW